VPQRIVATVVIVIAALLVLFVVGMFTVEGQPIALVPPRFESHLIKLDREAIDEAYKAHIRRLFDIWVTDYAANIGQPPRAVKGANNARGAYVQSITAIEKRESVLAPESK